MATAPLPTGQKRESKRLVDIEYYVACGMVLFTATVAATGIFVQIKSWISASGLSRLP